MWVSLIAITLVVAIGCCIAATMMQPELEPHPINATFEPSPMWIATPSP